MELLFVVLGGAMIGSIVRYTVPGRHAHGAIVVPGAGAIVAALLWAVLTWLGWAFDATWIWVVSLVAAGVASLALAIALPRRRRDADARLLERLRKSGTTA